MDVREVPPDGEVDLEVRVLAARRYRLELQFEASTRILTGEGTSGMAGTASPAAFPYRLRVLALGDGDLASDLYESARNLRDLFGLACCARSPEGARTGTSSTISHWGSVPLLEFESSTLGRIRFEFSIEPSEQGTVGAARFESHLDKAWLVLKEDVHKLRVPSALLDSLPVDLQARSLIGK